MQCIMYVNAADSFLAICRDRSGRVHAALVIMGTPEERGVGLGCELAIKGRWRTRAVWVEVMSGG